MLSQLVMLSQEYAEARRKSEELAAETGFYRKMSHALRTPLTIVSTNIQTARRRPEEAFDLLTDSQAEIMKMAAMISDALKDGEKGAGE
jgi:signal transduction histidine kinase